ncbi:MAG: FAD-dependent oxidoreductase, partial [Oscillospiraceae bacterium]|nr:FAD-dependent oxidoreductase [Oscillospiraceae bacterium]
MGTHEISSRTFVKGLAAGAASVVTLGVLQKVEYSINNAPAPGNTNVTVNPPVTTGNMTYTPGTYTASARGIASDVTVTMTFDEHSITDMQIDVSGETPDIGGKIGDEMRNKILGAQSCDVDGVSSATVTADAIKAAAADCISQASGQTVTVGGGNSSAGADWLGEAPEIPEADITETLDTEVLVVGCGTGGWITAMTAAEAGAKVLVVEKRETPTGIRHDIGAIDSRLQKESIAQDPKFAIDKMEAVQDIVRYAGGYVDTDLVKMWANESAELVDWLTDMFEADGRFVMRHEAGVGDLSDHARDKAYATGHSPEALGDASTEDVFQAVCDAHGVEWKLNTTLVKLDQDSSGKVTGIIAQDNADSHYIRINASKGVIMCAGGYASNTEMM